RIFSGTATSSRWRSKVSAFSVIRFGSNEAVPTNTKKVPIRMIWNAVPLQVLSGGTMSTYRAAVIGLSGIGAAARQPAPDPVLGEAMPHSHVAAYAAVPRTTLVAVCDLIPDLIEQTKREWSTDLPELHG